MILSHKTLVAKSATLVFKHKVTQKASSWGGNMSQGSQSLDPAILTCLSLPLPRQGYHIQRGGGQEELKEAFACLQDPKK